MLRTTAAHLAEVTKICVISDLRVSSGTCRQTLRSCSPTTRVVSTRVATGWRRWWVGSSATCRFATLASRALPSLPRRCSPVEARSPAPSGTTSCIQLSHRDRLYCYLPQLRAALAVSAAVSPSSTLALTTGSRVLPDERFRRLEFVFLSLLCASAIGAASKRQRAASAASLGWSIAVFSGQPPGKLRRKRGVRGGMYLRARVRQRACRACRYALRA